MKWAHETGQTTDRHRIDADNDGISEESIPNTGHTRKRTKKKPMHSYQKTEARTAEEKIEESYRDTSGNHPWQGRDVDKSGGTRQKEKSDISTDKNKSIEGRTPLKKNWGNERTKGYGRSREPLPEPRSRRLTWASFKRMIGLLFTLAKKTPRTPLYILGWGIAFPGIIVHEFAHKKACEWRGVTVYDVEYLSQSGGGRLSHAPTNSLSSTLTINTAPFAVNSVLSYTIFFILFYIFSPVGLSYQVGGIAGKLVELIAITAVWIAVSIGSHAMPSKVDAGNVWRKVREQGFGSPLIIISIPVVLLMYTLSTLKHAWIGYVYAFTLAVLAGLSVQMFV